MSTWDLTEEEKAAGKTIKMPKRKLARLLKALRSGEYIQTSGILHNPEDGGFCCLGLEQYINNKCKVEVEDTGEFRSLPSLEYLEQNGITYLDNVGEPYKCPFVRKIDAEETQSFAALNDIGTSFEKIADIWEAHAVGY